MQNEMTKELTTPGTGPNGVLKIREALAAADELGVWLAKSGSFGCKTLEQGKMLALMCIMEGGNLREFKASYHVTDRGDLVPRADAMLGKYKRLLGGRFTYDEKTEQRCAITFVHADYPDGITDEFTIEQAKSKGLIKSKSAWETWPEDMLLSTVVRKHMRQYHPDVFAGAYGEDKIAYDTGTEALPVATAPAVPTTPIIAPPPDVLDMAVLNAALDIAGVRGFELLSWAVAKGYGRRVDLAPLETSLQTIKPDVLQGIIDKPAGFSAAYVNWVADQSEADALESGMVLLPNDETAPDSEPTPDADAEPPQPLSEILKALGLPCAGTVEVLRGHGWIPKGGKAKWTMLDELAENHDVMIRSAPDAFAEQVKKAIIADPKE